MSVLNWTNRGAYMKLRRRKKEQAEAIVVSEKKIALPEQIMQELNAKADERATLRVENQRINARKRD